MSIAILRETSTETSYQMIQLVFLPYTQLRQSICTLESLWSSIRISPDFNPTRHTSPFFGSMHLSQLIKIYRYSFQSKDVAMQRVQRSIKNSLANTLISFLQQKIYFSKFEMLWLNICKPWDLHLRIFEDKLFKNKSFKQYKILDRQPDQIEQRTFGNFINYFMLFNPILVL